MASQRFDDQMEKSGNNREIVDKFLKKNQTDQRVLSRLRGKYGDSSKVDQIFSAYKQSKDMAEKRARKFLNVLTDKYNNYTAPQIYEKALQYKNRVGMTDGEFELFRHMVFSQRSEASQYTFNVPTTRMAQLFGYSVHESVMNNELNVKPQEEGVVQEILRSNAENRTLHAQIIEQTHSYQSFAPQAMNGQYNNDKHNVFNYVNPVIAALFLPKIEVLEEHMLYASISNIVKLKHQGAPITTKPEYSLLWNMMTDPNDAVCDIDSPIKDVKNRVELQVALWNNVLNLRQGKYYLDNATDFLVTVENCRVNMFDTPDLSIVRDEGIILRRMLSAFSFRPTIISTTPLDMGGAGMGNSYLPVPQNPSMTMVTSVPMIAIRLPSMEGGGSAEEHSTINLEDSTQQEQWFIENNRFVSKMQTVLNSERVLIFYVPRRFQQIDYIRRLYPHRFNSLPLHVNATSDINTHPVRLQRNINVGKEKSEFNLRSVVVVDAKKLHHSGSSDDNTRTIVGSSTYLYDDKALQDGSNSDPYPTWLYDPSNANVYKDKPGNSMTRRLPTETIRRDDGHLQNYKSSAQVAKDKVECNGTIYVYVLNDQRTFNQ